MNLLFIFLTFNIFINDTAVDDLFHFNLQKKYATLTYIKIKSIQLKINSNK